MLTWKDLRCFIGVHWFVKMNIWGDKRCLQCGVIRTCVFLMLLALAACAGPQMPIEPFRCFDALGKEVPCIEEMDCHEEPKGKEL